MSTRATDWCERRSIRAGKHEGMAVSVIFAAFGTAAGLSWLAAVGVGALGWLRAQPRPYRLAGLLIWVGLTLALASWAWNTAGSWPAWAPVRAVHASGLAVSALVLVAVLRRRGSESLAWLLVCAFSIVAQGWSACAMWWGGAVDASAAVLPVWMVARDLMGLVGGGALVVAVSAIVARHIVCRIPGRLPAQWKDDIASLPSLELASERVALGALTLSLSFDVARSWLGWGDMLRPGTYCLVIAWILLAAGAGGWMPGTVSRRVANLLAVLALAATCVAMAGPL